jgi:hypothetical protein
VIARVVFLFLTVLFVTLGVVRGARDDSWSHPQTRTWLLLGLIFAVVSVYLFYQG